MPTIEQRLEALEQLLATPLAAVPPITIGSLNNVPAPGSPIAAQWAQDVTGIAVHRFATTAALKAWAAPNGVLAIALDTVIVWRRVGGVWSQYSPYSATVIGIATPGPHANNTGIITIANIVVPADAGIRTAYATCHLRIDITAAVACTANLNIGGTVVAQSSVGPALGQHYVNMAASAALPANAAASVSVQLTNTGPLWQPDVVTYAALPLNRVDVLAVPR